MKWETRHHSAQSWKYWVESRYLNTAATHALSNFMDKLVVRSVKKLAAQSK